MGQNSTKNSTGNGTSRGSRPTRLPMYRTPQTQEAVLAELGAAGALNILVLVLNILLIIAIHRKLHSIPWLMIQNIAVIDLLTSLICGFLLCFGLMLDPFGLIILPDICNIQGFFHNAFSMAFLNTVSLVAGSRLLLYHSPSMYRNIFANKTLLRIFLLTIWAVSGLLAASPLNNGLLGAYRRFEATCWLAWKNKDSADMAYNFLVTLTSLGTALFLTAFAIVSAWRMGTIYPEPPSIEAATSVAPTKSPLPPAPLPVNTTVLKISSAQLLIYLVIWLPLTVLDSLFLQSFLLVDLPVTLTFLFLFFARGLLNPVICLVFGPTLAEWKAGIDEQPSA